ncbi:MAG: RdgB/HAM1 family non-canonical purine NTP pyrophosphatase [Solitalea-like symbiont of Tyrophagus putrescentiae]
MKKCNLYFITNNKHKIQEAQRILGPNIKLNDNLDISIPEIDETGLSYKENADQKLLNGQRYLTIDCFSEDSGLEVEALNNEPGIFSARYSLFKKSDLSNIELLMQQMHGIANRKARFVAVIALYINKKKYFFEGQIQGLIADKPSNSRHGFGYDPIFIPDGYSITFAELPSSVKQNISHRAIALKKLSDFIFGKNL